MKITSIYPWLVACSASTPTVQCSSMKNLVSGTSVDACLSECGADCPAFINSIYTDYHYPLSPKSRDVKCKRNGVDTFKTVCAISPTPFHPDSSEALTQQLQKQHLQTLARNVYVYKNNTEGYKQQTTVDATPLHSQQNSTRVDGITSDTSAKSFVVTDGAWETPEAFFEMVGLKNKEPMKAQLVMYTQQALPADLPDRSLIKAYHALQTGESPKTVKGYLDEKVAWAGVSQATRVAFGCLIVLAPVVFSL